MAVCSICEDTGFVFDVKTGTSKTCKCVMKRRVQDYLKHYSKYRINKKLCTERMLDDYNILGDLHSFGTTLASVLTYILFKVGAVSWLDITGQDLVSTTFGDEEELWVNDLQNIEFLIIKLGRDGYNKAMGGWLLNLVIHRQEHEKMTWLWTYPNVSDAKLREVYGEDFITYIRDKVNFKTVKVK